jgi:hypothetical protein
LLRSGRNRESLEIAEAAKRVLCRPSGSVPVALTVQAAHSFRARDWDGARNASEQAVGTIGHHGDIAVLFLAMALSNQGEFLRARSELRRAAGLLGAKPRIDAYRESLLREAKSLIVGLQRTCRDR